jgi:suppressor for copper-sensitivity B
MTRPSILRLRRAALLGLGALALAAGADAQFPRPEKAKLAVLTDRTAYEAGSTARVGARVTIEPEWHVNSHKPTFEYLIPTVLKLELPAGWPEETVRYPKAKMQSFAFENQPLSVYDGEVAILSEIRIPAGTAPGTFPVHVSLRYQSCNKSQCLPPVTTKAEVTLTVGPGGTPIESPLFAGSAGAAAAEAETARPTGTAGTAGTVIPPSLFLMLGLAVLGGLILNAMPCVLPVLSIKVFGLVRSAGHGRAEVVRGSLATAAGILFSFWALALAAIAARAAGAAVGWGVQFQRPGFVAFLTVIVVLFCLNLWGLFEIPLPQWAARIGGNGPREGVAGHFFSGLFATLMATPCSAPFLGTAIGFALGQKAGLILAIFTGVGFGMALPYLLLAAAPGTARFLPRPGAWMDTVRGVMGFLLAAAAVWLFYVLSAQMSPERVAFIQLGLLGLALFTWMRHRGVRGPSLQRLAGVGMAAAVALILLLAVRGGAPARAAEGRSGDAGLIAWVPFDRVKAESLAASGQLVFVDVTADWCFTCKVNERLVLETPEVSGAFQRHNVIAMRADWTNRDDQIGKFLADHGRYGIPFYALYRPGNPPHVFSELLNKETLVSEVEATAGKVAAR